MQSTTGAKAPECLFGFLTAHWKWSLSSLMIGTAGPLLHTHTLLPISKDVLFMRANLVWTMPHWYSSQCLLSPSRDLEPLWAAIYLIPFPKKGRYLPMMRWRGHNSNSGSVELSIGSVISYHRERAATEIGERRAGPKIVASAFQKHINVFVQSLFFFVLPISNGDYWHVLCVLHRVQC